MKCKKNVCIKQVLHSIMPKQLQTLKRYKYER